MLKCFGVLVDQELYESDCSFCFSMVSSISSTFVPGFYSLKNTFSRADAGVDAALFDLKSALDYSPVLVFTFNSFFI